MQRSDRHSQPEQDRDDRDLLAELAQRVEWLRPDHRNPHRFHEEKSEIAHELGRWQGG